MLRLALVVFLIQISFLVGNSDVRAQEPKKTTEPAGPTDLVKIYKDNCADCHGDSGTGNRMRKSMPSIPDFTSLAWQMSQTDLEIAHRIQDGHEPAMPAYRDEITQPQILALSIYVRAFSIKGMVPKGAEPPANDRSARMTALQLYHAYCLACHDASGRGTTMRKAMPEIPDFGDSKWQTARSDAELKHSILEGKGKFMLPMKDKLGQADADAMVAFLRAFRDGRQVVELEPRKPEIIATSPALIQAKPAVIARPPARVAANAPSAKVKMNIGVVTRIYRQYCLTCHGVDGKGTEMRPSMPTLPDFTTGAWHQGKTDEQMTVSVLEGKGALMPSFQGRVDTDQARDVVAYVRAFGPVRSQPVAAATPAPGEFETRLQQLQQQWDAMEKEIKALSDKRKTP